MADSELRVGDEVFMIGRFVNLQGGGINRPAARFGTLSVMLENIGTKDAAGRRTTQESFAVEMRSRTGYSGSPVMVYRTAATVLRPVPDDYTGFFGLLGVNWGYIKDEEGENSFINGVVPAWHISELFDLPPLRAHQDKHEARCAEIAALRREGDDTAAPTALWTEESDPEAHPRHKEDFSALLSPAVRPPKQGGQT